MKALRLLLVVALLTSLTFTVLANDSIMDLIKDADSSGEKVIDKADNAISILINKILPLFGVLMLGIGGLYLASGSDRGKSKVAYAVIGIGIIALAPSLTGWILSLFK